MAQVSGSLELATVHSDVMAVPFRLLSKWIAHEMIDPFADAGTSEPDDFLYLGPISEYQRYNNWPIFSDTPIGSRIRYQFYYQILWSAEDALGHMAGLYPGHVVDFNFENEGEEGEGGRRQLVVGGLLAKTVSDAVYTAMLWDSEHNAPVYGLVRAPTLVSPVRWGSGVCEYPKLGLITPRDTLAKVMPSPEVTAAIRLLLPAEHAQAFAQCHNHTTYLPSSIRNLDKDFFLSERLFPNIVTAPPFYTGFVEHPADVTRGVY